MGRGLGLPALLLALVSVGGLHAQELSTHERIGSLDLRTLDGEVRVYYSEGFSDRALYIQDLAEAARRFFARPEITGVDLELAVALLGPADWAEVSGVPYGTSHILSEPFTAVLPASSDNMLTAGVLEAEKGASERTLERIAVLGYSFPEAARMLSDFIGFHEMGHIFAEAYGIQTWPEEKWLGEFVATYLAYAFLKEYRLELADLWEAVNDAMVESGPRQHSSLADFEELYLGVGPDYGWYQGRFQQRAKAVYGVMGISFIHALKVLLAEKPDVTPDDQYRLKELDSICAGFLIWAKGETGDLLRTGQPGDGIRRWPDFR